MPKSYHEVAKSQERIMIAIIAAVLRSPGRRPVGASKSCQEG
jgi:hypothetical protein